MFVYADNAATTKMSKTAIDAMLPYLDTWYGNASSLYAFGQKSAEALAAEGINVRVINVCSIKPLDEETILAAARECGKIVTCEEHSIIGGLGEAVSTALSEHCPTPVTRIGVNDVYGHSGPAVDLLKEFGLSAEHIAEVIREKLAK